MSTELMNWLRPPLGCAEAFEGVTFGAGKLSAQSTSYGRPSQIYVV